MTSDSIAPNENPSERVDIRLVRALSEGSLPRDLLICGPAGTGKTWSILSVIHQLAADYRDLRILFVRQTRASLTDSVMVTLEQEILPADGLEGVAQGATRSHRSSYRYPNGSEIVLAGMDNPTRITSTAWDLIFVNESIELQEDSWETLASRLNRPGRDPQWGYLIGDTNPGDPAHWLKKRCDKGQTTLWNTSHEANPALHDGENWTEVGEQYLGRLGTLQGTRRKRYLIGVWAAGEGVWFETFDDVHQSVLAEYDPAYPVHLAVDSGVHTGAVWFQIKYDKETDEARVNIFGDYYSEKVPAYDNAKAILAKGKALCGGKVDRCTTDPAGKSPSAVSNSTVASEYKRAGLKPDFWPSFPGSVLAGLTLVEGFVSTSPPDLIVHPRCHDLISAFSNYKRAKRAGQWIDRPEDPQHPYEDMLDALRGGLLDKFPQGRKPKLVLRNMNINRLRY